jgi:glutathione S-transferase
VLEHGAERLTQSGVILDYLAELTGRFRPSDARSRRECWRWILFDNHKFTSYFATYRFLKSLSAQPGDPAVLAFLEGRAKSAFHIVEKHLSAQPFLVGSEPTIADISLCGYVFYPKEEHGFDFAGSFPAIEAWRGRIRELPGWKGPYELMPGGRR